MHQLFSRRDCDRTSATFRVPIYRSQEGVISHARGEHSSAPPVKRQRGLCQLVAPICGADLLQHFSRYLLGQLSGIQAVANFALYASRVPHKHAQAMHSVLPVLRAGSFKIYSRDVCRTDVSSAKGQCVDGDAT